MNTEQKKGARAILTALNRMLDSEEAEIPLMPGRKQYPPYSIPIDDFRRWLKNLRAGLKKRKGKGKDEDRAIADFIDQLKPEPK